MKVNFDYIAPFYDSLVKIVFGDQLWQAQRAHFHHIGANQKILILGGGTGKILKWLPVDCDITYLELSAKMLKRARRHGKADFIQADFLEYSLRQQYDWIICPFFLDVFTPKVLPLVIDRIKSLLSPNGQLIVTDFRIGKPRHRALVKGMLLFFKLSAFLKTSELVNLRKALILSNFQIKATMELLNGLVFSDIYSLEEKKYHFF